MLRAEDLRRHRTFQEFSKGSSLRTLDTTIESSSVPVNFENSTENHVIEKHYAKRNVSLSGPLFVGGTLLLVVRGFFTEMNKKRFCYCLEITFQGESIFSNGCYNMRF